MDVLKGMTIFVEVANQQGFAPAARALELSTSAVSRYVIELEDWLGIQLFHRTTRKLSLTEEGAFYLSRCQQVIADVDDIKQVAIGNLTEPQGNLRITAPVFIAKAWLQDLLPGFLNRYPQVSLELTAVDRVVDLVAEGYDLALRARELADSTLVARRLMDVNLALVASPTYLAEYGTPTSIDDLKSHNCLVDTVAGYTNRWPLLDGKKRKLISVSGNACEQRRNCSITRTRRDRYSVTAPILRTQGYSRQPPRLISGIEHRLPRRPICRLSSTSACIG